MSALFIIFPSPKSTGDLLDKAAPEEVVVPAEVVLLVEDPPDVGGMLIVEVEVEIDDRVSEVDAVDSDTELESNGKDELKVKVGTGGVGNNELVCGPTGDGATLEMELEVLDTSCAAARALRMAMEHAANFIFVFERISLIEVRGKVSALWSRCGCRWGRRGRRRQGQGQRWRASLDR